MVSGCLLISDPKVKVRCSVPSGDKPVLTIKRNYIISHIREITFWYVPPEKEWWRGGGDENMIWKIKFVDPWNNKYKLKFGNLGGVDGLDACEQIFPEAGQTVTRKLSAGEAFRVEVEYAYDYYFGPSDSAADFYIMIKKDGACKVIEYNFLDEYNKAFRR